MRWDGSGLADVAEDVAEAVRQLPGIQSYTFGRNRATGQYTNVSQYDIDEHARWTPDRADRVKPLHDRLQHCRCRTCNARCLAPRGQLRPLHAARLCDPPAEDRRLHRAPLDGALNTRVANDRTDAVTDSTFFIARPAPCLAPPETGVIGEN